MPTPHDGEPILRVENLRKGFVVRRDLVDVVARRHPRLVAVDDVSFELGAHQALGIVGESGSGKSTVAKCLVRLHEPDGGSVSFHGKDVLAARGSDLAALRRSMQLIYQDPYSSLNPLMSVGRAISEAATVHGLVPEGDSSSSYVGSMLEMVGLSNAVARRRPRQLSGGQRQRVAIARAMAAQPEVLVADEPISALDVSIQAQILDVFQKLRAEQGVGLILIAHQLNVVAHITDTVMVMYLGRIVEAGPTARVFSEPRHPYTVGLLEAQPGRHRRGKTRQPALKGEIPSPLNIPTGCRFRTRCPHAQEICATVDPPPVDLGGGHRAWCHFADASVARDATTAATGASNSAESHAV